MEVQMQHKLFKAGQQTANLESLAQKLEARLMIMETSAGNDPQAEVSNILDATQPLPGYTDVKGRVPALAKKSQALESLVQKLAARIAFLEATLVPPSLSDEASQVSPGKVISLIPEEIPAASHQTMKNKRAVKSLSEASQRISAYEGLAEKLESRLMHVEADFGLDPRAEITQVLGSSPELPSNADMYARIPALINKSAAMQNVVSNLDARIDFLESHSQDELLSEGFAGKISSSTQKTLIFEALAEKLEARLMLLEAASGKSPEAEVSKILGTTTMPLQRIVSDEAKVPVLAHKGVALQSLVQKMTARISALEAGFPPSLSAFDDPPNKSMKQAPVELKKQQSYILSEGACMQESRVESELAQESQDASALESLAEKYEARILLLEEASGNISRPFVSEDLSTTPALPANASFEVRVPLLNQKSTALEILANKMAARIAYLEAESKKQRKKAAKALKGLDPQLHQERLLQKQATKGLQIMKGESNKELETMKVAVQERSSNDAAIKALEQQLQQERLLQEQANKELQIMKGEANRELETIKGLELQLEQERDRAILQEQANKELEAKLAAALAERQQHSTANAMMHEQTLKELEAKLLAAAAERQQQSSERVLLHEQTIKELEAKLAAAAEERQQLATSGEGFQVEVLAQKQRVLEYEERVRGLTDDNMRLQEVLQEQREKISLLTSQFDGERKQLLEQADSFKSKITKLEEAQSSLTASLSVAELASPPAPVPMSPKIGPPRRTPAVGTGGTSPLVKTMSEHSLPYGSIKAPALVYSGTPLSTRVSPPQSVMPVQSTRSMSPGEPLVQVMSPYASSPNIRYRQFLPKSAGYTAH